MPSPAVIAAGVAALLKGLGAFTRKKSNDKKAKEQKRATTAAATLAQKRAEDARIARVRLGASFLNGVPATTAGGRVRTNVGLDPAVQAELEKERTYDFGDALPDPGAGGTSGFLSGLFGELGDTVSGAYGAPSPSPTPRASSGGAPTRLPSSLLTPPGGITRTPWTPFGGGDEPGLADNNGGLTVDDLLELLKIKPGGGTSEPNYTPDPESGGF